jgi:hypothetical protein
MPSRQIKNGSRLRPGLKYKAQVATDSEYQQPNESQQQDHIKFSTTTKQTTELLNQSLLSGSGI